MMILFNLDNNGNDIVFTEFCSQGIWHSMTLKNDLVNIATMLDLWYKGMKLYDLTDKDDDSEMMRKNDEVVLSYKEVDELLDITLL